MRIATTRYPLEIFASYDQAYEKLKINCMNAKDADVILFPEYAGLEWVWGYKKSFYENVHHFQKHGLAAYKDALLELACICNITIIGGSVPVYDDGYYFNRCYIAHPTRKLLWQNKVNLTPSEKSLGWLNGGDTIKIFQSDFGSFSVCICYDSEFPEIVSHAVFNGADVVLIPSYTDSEHGAYRVQIAARARAMENQCFAVTATCTGKVDCDEFDGSATGDPGIFTPIDSGFPIDGILEKSRESDIISANLDVSTMKRIRSEGQVHNFCDRINFKTINIEKESL